MKDLGLNIGGPQTLNQKQIAHQAFEALGNTSKIAYIPVFITRMILFLIRVFTSSRTYGPVEFFMTFMTMNMQAPEYGTRSLREHYHSLASEVSSAQNI